MKKRLRILFWIQSIMKVNKKLTFIDVYQLPLRFNEYSKTYVWSKNNIMTFTQLVGYKDSDFVYIQKLLDIINSDTSEVVKDAEYIVDKGHIRIDGKPVFLLRGWGHLTGVGALNLDDKTAAKIQDDFAEWVVNKLKGNE